MLLGDSIRMSYQGMVQNLLKDEAVVWGPEENCQYSLYTAMRLDAYLNEFGSPDVVHWNNGLHDLGCRLQRGPMQFSIGDYLINLSTILTRLTTAGAKVIWASTTPVNDVTPPVIPNWCWANTDVVKYNLCAGNLMRAHSVTVNDLYSVIAGHPEYYSDDNIHLAESGKMACAQQVVKILRENW
jgi:hypothetical protein